MILDFGLKQKTMANSRDQRNSGILIEKSKIKNSKLTPKSLPHTSHLSPNPPLLRVVIIHAIGKDVHPTQAVVVVGDEVPAGLSVR